MFNQLDAKQQQAQQQKLKMMEQACESGNAEACFSLRDIQFGNVAMPMPKMSEGGELDIESLLSPGMEMAEQEIEGGVDFTALKDILGEEKFEQLEEAMEMHPVVMEVAEMAMHTSDGEVDGMGGPKDDQVPARLSPGEFVFSVEAVEALGLDYLEELHEKGKQMAASL